MVITQLYPTRIRVTAQEQKFLISKPFICLRLNAKYIRSVFPRFRSMGFLRIADPRLNTKPGTIISRDAKISSPYSRISIYLTPFGVIQTYVRLVRTQEKLSEI